MSLYISRIPDFGSTYNTTNAHKRIPLMEYAHGRNYYFTHKSTHLPRLFSEGKQVKNEQRIKGFKSTDKACQYILGISHEIYPYSTELKHNFESYLQYAFS